MSITAGNIVLILSLVLANEPHHFSMHDFWQKKCRENDQIACEKLEVMREDVKKLERLNQRAELFGQQVDRAQLEEGNKPRLDQAYHLVMRDHINDEQEKDNAPLKYEKVTINYCADHFHNYWANKKLWWPTDAAGKPSWPDIYIYIVDHYYGVCLRRDFKS